MTLLRVSIYYVDYSGLLAITAVITTVQGDIIVSKDDKKCRVEIF